MRLISLLVFVIFSFGYAKDFVIIDKPIDFSQNRVSMTKDYIKNHYGLNVHDITIDPKIIVLHWTAVPTLEASFERLKPELLLTDRKDIAKAGAVNVSSHFLVDRDGTIYRLMPENYMGRHTIGLNYNSIGIENVGGKGDKSEDLTQAQVEANAYLVRYLKNKYPNIEYLMGHHEYFMMKKTRYWLERDPNYFTFKNDPGDKFMADVRKRVKDLHLVAPVLTKDYR
ncbi:putative N-acetylmuramoyl-L-alanine amidase [Sulfurovum sp. enrichment culture clone C5]|uniref:N-acetylmuramoyl-L-alanine amidase n=1 Tax=Sulfurovum sp. enrichment culture clone C5 TaxID=497650 RepID=A0A0S4XNP7_9BACT|nr:putative N-acetylmuramoyl-L-alanine amidase [Sulfurovum sp. enrichment culture clone C5]